MNMAFTSTRICFMVFLLSAIQITFLSTVTVGEKYVSSWSPWSKCSKDCDGIQIRTRKCIDLSAKCEEALEEERDCSNTTWSTGCFCEYQECSCLKANKSRLHFALRFILMINMKSYNQAKKRNNMPAKHDVSYLHLRKTGTVSWRR